VGRPLDAVFRIVNEDTRASVESPAVRALRDGVVVGLANHTLLIRKDGAELAIDDSAAPIRAADGSVVGAVLIFRDITDRRRLERERAMLLDKERAARLEAERLSEELLHLQGVTDIALSNLPAPALMRELLQRVCAALKSDSATVFLLRPDGQCLSPVASHGLHERHGEDIEVPHGHGIVGRVAASRRGMIVDDVGEVEVVDPFLREHLTSLIAAPLQIAERVIGVINVGTATPRRFTQGDLRLLSLVADRLALTIERTRLQEEEGAARIEVATSEEQLRLALEAGRMGTWEWTIASGDVRWSAGLEAIHGMPPGSFPGTFGAVQKEIHTDDRDRVLQAISNAVELGHEYQVEYRIVRPDGAVRWVKGIGQISRDSGGRPNRMVGVCSDITERKQAEDALKEADRRKDEFLAVLSHELRDPLSAVIGWAEMLRSGGVTGERTTYGLEVIERNARAEARLVESLLDLSRISAGKLELHMTRVDVASLVRAAVDAIRPGANAKGVDVEVTIASSPAFMVGDGGRLQQVMSNLLSNAVKFTPPGGHVRIGLAHADSHIQLQVADDGEGMSPEFLPLVFDRFRQAETRTDRRHAGLGLGLTIVREFVHAHGGRVSADSAGPGKGSTFTVMLPIRAVGSVASAQGAAASGEGSTRSVAGLRVLVADDDRDARELLALTLESRGAIVRTVSSAAEALDVIAREKVHVLLADIGMPDEDGYSLLRNVRDVERRQQRGRLPAIAVTAYATSTDREQALAAGYDLHLAKPVDPTALVQAVARFAAAEA
jgi:PAS domain S-box-containing protein